MSRVVFGMMILLAIPCQVVQAQSEAAVDILKLQMDAIGIQDLFELADPNQQVQNLITDMKVVTPALSVHQNEMTYNLDELFLVAESSQIVVARIDLPRPPMQPMLMVDQSVEARTTLQDFSAFYENSIYEPVKILVCLCRYRGMLIMSINTTPLGALPNGIIKQEIASFPIHRNEKHSFASSTR